MIPLRNELLLFVKGTVHRYATLWEIERVDETKFRFTDHSHTIDYGGYLFVPTGGFNASAIEYPVNFATAGFESMGLVTSDAITQEDLRAGKFHHAKVTRRIVDWLYPWAGFIRKDVFWITNIRYNESVWYAEFSGLTNRLKRRRGSVYSSTCRHRLGDSNCGVTLSSYKTAGAAVTAITTQRKDFETDLTEEDNYFSYGYIEWLTGENAGLSHEVSKSYLSNGRLVLHLSTEFDIAVGDTFDAYAGCNKQFSTCGTKFNNAVNFGGFPWIPGPFNAYQPR